MYIYCDYCVYHYKSTELVSLYTLDIGLKINIIIIIIVKIMLTVCIVGEYGGLSERGLCVFCKLCPVCFLVVGKVRSVLL